MRIFLERNLGQISACHRLPTHKGQCKNLHGHNYTVIISIEMDMPEGNKYLDFSRVKDLARKVLWSTYDHKTWLYYEDSMIADLKKHDVQMALFLDEPTCEAFVGDALRLVVRELQDAGVISEYNVHSVTITASETDNCRITATLPCKKC